MALEQRLETKLLQKLILTPQLQQAIRLLQLPQLELSQTLTEELVENPFLEEVTEDISRDEEMNSMADNEAKEIETYQHLGKLTLKLAEKEKLKNSEQIEKLNRLLSR